MSSYFARHEVDSKAEGWNPGENGYPSAGRVAWALWGGDPARDWVEQELARVEKAAPKVLCFYHRDLDGVASAAVVRQAHPDAELRSINYGEEFPWDAINGREIVYMVDFGLQPFKDMIKLKRELDAQDIRFVWVDHHATALKDAADFDCDGLRKIGDAGCELTWKYLNPDDPIPEVIRYAGRFDVWDHSDPDTMLIHYAMEAIEEANDPSSDWWKTWLKKKKGDFGDLIESGKAIQSWLEQFNAGRMGHTAFAVKFEGLNCVAANTSIPGSMQYESVRKGHDAAISFGFSPSNQWDVSMYGLKPDADVGAVCVKYGGGGHKGAGGFQCKRLPFDLPKDDTSKVAKANSPSIEPLSFFKPMMPEADPISDRNDALKAMADRLESGVGVQPMLDGDLVVVHKQDPAGDAQGAVAIFVGGAQEDRSEEMSGVVKAARKVGGDFIFVGQLMPTQGKEESGPAVVVCDVVYWRGQSLIGKQWKDRQKALSQALPKAVGYLVPSPARLANSRDSLQGALTWASQVHGSTGAMLTDAASTYQPGASSPAMVVYRDMRIVNALVVGRSGDAGEWIYQVAVGPLSESESARAEESVEQGDRKYLPAGKTDPTSVEAKDGDVLRLEVGEILLVDSADSATVRLHSSKVLERVAVKPATLAEVRALARPHEIQKLCKIIKRDSERHYVLSVVLEPNDGDDGAPLDPDAHREIYSADEIWDACVYWYESGSQLGVMHEREASTGEMLPIHNFIAPVDMQIGDDLVREGTWLLGSLIQSADLWRRVERGELNAWSVDGRALRRPEAKAA